MNYLHKYYVLQYSSNFFPAIAFVWPANQSRDANLLLQPHEVTTRIWPSSVVCHQNQGDSPKQLDPNASQDLFLLGMI